MTLYGRATHDDVSAIEFGQGIINSWDQRRPLGHPDSR